MRVKLRSHVADDVGVRHGTFRPAVIDVPASMLQAIGDAVLLNVRLDALLQPQPAAAEPTAAPWRRARPSYFTYTRPPDGGEPCRELQG